MRNKLSSSDTSNNQATSNSKEVEDLRQQIAALQEALKESQAIAEKAERRSRSCKCKSGRCW